MRVQQNLFDFGDAGILALSTCSSVYATVPATPFGSAQLWRDGAHLDLLELCTRPVSLSAQQAAVAALRARLAGAVASVQAQIDWLEAQRSQGFRELPTHARQLGGDRLLLGFVGVIEPGFWRLVDVARRSVLWESDPEDFEAAFRRGGAKWKGLAAGFELQLPLAAGADFVEIQRGMARPVFVLQDERLVLADWSVTHPQFADHAGLRSGMLRPSDTDPNAFALVDPRTGQVLRTIVAPTRSRGGSRAAATPGCNRIALAHEGGTVDIIDGLGATAFSIRPFPRLGRNERLEVRLSNDGQWLGADGWEVFRVVNLATREVAELDVPVPNMQDDPARVLYDRSVLATGRGVAVMDEAGLRLTPHAGLRWEPVTQPAAGRARKAAAPHAQHLDAWRRPALTLKPARRSRSWLYGAPDLAESDTPTHQGRPMRLLARIDMAEVADLCPDGPWPAQGALYVFIAVDDAGDVWLDECLNPVATRVLWRSQPGSSAGGHEHVLAPKQALALARHRADLPDIGAAIVAAAGLDDAGIEAYRAWLEQKGWSEQPGGHRLGGYPTILQRNDLEAQAARLVGASSDAADSAAASRWRLLLQLDSDEVCMWGSDSGILYFFIHEDDLARGEFSRVVAFCEGL